MLGYCDGTVPVPPNCACASLRLVCPPAEGFEAGACYWRWQGCSGYDSGMTAWFSGLPKWAERFVTGGQSLFRKQGGMFAATQRASAERSVRVKLTGEPVDWIS